jgi:hypothetical protein
VEDHQDVRIIAVPYDSGHAGLRMGAGPEHLLDNGFGEGLRSGGRKPNVTTVRHEKEPTAEVATAFELHGLVSHQVLSPTVPVTVCSLSSSERLHYPRPETLFEPLAVPTADRAVGSELLLWQILPRRAGLHDPQDPAKHLSVIASGTP